MRVRGERSSWLTSSSSWSREWIIARTRRAIRLNASVRTPNSSSLCFVDTLWPDFGKEHLEQAVAEFRRRDRRYGGVGS